MPHASPIKIIPNCAGPLACFKDLSHPWECTAVLTSNPGKWRGLSCNIPFLLLHTSPIKIGYCFAGPLACFNYLSWGRLPSNLGWGEGRGGGVVIFTPWYIMLHHCFAGPLACFRYIFWNVQKGTNKLSDPPGKRKLSG